MRDLDKESQICSFLEKKLAFFNEYLAITKRIRKALGNKEQDKVGVMLSERQACIHRIERIDLSIKRVAGVSLNPIGEVPGRFRRLIERAIGKTRDIMAKVDLMDKELIAMAAEECDCVKSELLKIQGVRRAARGYRNGRRTAPRFLDTLR